ncbi:hypothetical protein N7493_010325 [Penicillium malachiteum]|uniref:Uncharacterized protein n=1 Tax=Penicillium malachiteum TaxID=1324776 RepID=A0AAD6HCK4_9EURO|nr:hypothetical protein N7493_010325 [Penicillium malachiteum]
MVVIPHSAQGLAPTLNTIADSVGTVAGSSGSISNGVSWSNMTTTHTNDPVTGEKASNTITETTHKTTVDPTAAIGSQWGWWCV